LARLLAEGGWDLTLLARDPGRLEAARVELAGRGARVLVHSVDVADPAGVEWAVRSAVRAHGPPSLVVAGAGMVVPRLFEAQPLEAFRRSMDVNYFGALHLARASLPAMRAAGGGRIVLIASAAALLGLYGYTSYAPAKFAVRGLAEALRSELAPDGIGVSLVYPPDTDTPGYRDEVRTRPEVTSRVAGTGGMIGAEQVARAILRGVRRGRFVIAPSWEMATLSILHSLIAPLLHRFWFDPQIARALRRERGSAPQAHAATSTDPDGATKRG
jgi:3-dehydrosphinganine reductase